MEVLHFDWSLTKELTASIIIYSQRLIDPTHPKPWSMQSLIQLLLLFSLFFVPCQAKEVHQCLISTSASELNSSLHPLLKESYSRSIYLALFSDWIHQHHIKIESNELFVHRLQIFIDNDEFIRLTNKQNLSFKLGHNAFSHLTFEEWRQSRHFGFVS